MKARAREKAIEFVERNMYVAKEAMAKEVKHITSQFDKQVQETEALKKHAKMFERIIIDQETIINNLKNFIVLQFQKNPPNYTDDDEDTSKFTTKQGVGISARVVSLRALEHATNDKLLNQVFSLYGASVRLNIDHRLDMQERIIIA
jgi:hypothetical protein